MTTPKALREMCEQVLASGLKSDAAKTIASALLDRLSGEAVTLDTIARTIWGHMFPEHPPEHWWKEDEYIRGKYLECAKVVSSLLPAGMDTGWLPIESAPNDGTPIWMWAVGWREPLVGRQYAKGWKVGAGGHELHSTHWHKIIIPQPPNPSAG